MAFNKDYIYIEGKGYVPVSRVAKGRKRENVGTQVNQQRLRPVNANRRARGNKLEPALCQLVSKEQKGE